MAEEASAMMKKKAYGRKIENATKKINEAVEALVRKYVPAPVIACVAEYSDYFDKTSNVGITTMRETKWGLSSENRIYGLLSFKVPSICSCLKVDRKDYDDLLKLETKKKALQKQNEYLNSLLYGGDVDAVFDGKFTWPVPGHYYVSSPWKCSCSLHRGNHNGLVFV